MVDINLIGDDQDQFDGEENDKDKDFQDSFESDVGEHESGNYMSDSGIDGSEYSNYMNRGGSKKSVYILIAGSIILLFIVGYFLIYSGKDKEPETSTYLTEQPAADDTVDTSSLEDETATMSTVSPAVREKLRKSQAGVNTVSNIITTVPENVNFTMITYNDGKFLVEFLANNDNAITNVNSNLKQKLYDSEMKILSRNRRNIMGRSYRQALMNGNVNVGDGSGEFGTIREPKYLNANDLKNQLSRLCGQSGLALKQFDAGKNKIEGDFEIVPIKFRAVGTKSNILNFLQQVVDENVNINFTKISLIANDVDLSDSNISLVLNIELYQMI